MLRSAVRHAPMPVGSAARQRALAARRRRMCTADAAGANDTFGASPKDNCSSSNGDAESSVEAVEALLNAIAAHNQRTAARNGAATPAAGRSATNSAAVSRAQSTLRASSLSPTPAGATVLSPQQQPIPGGVVRTFSTRSTVGGGGGALPHVSGGFGVGGGYRGGGGEASGTFLLFPLPPPQADVDSLLEEQQLTAKGRRHAAAKTAATPHQQRRRALLSLTPLLSVTAVRHSVATHVNLAPTLWDLAPRPAALKAALAARGLSIGQMDRCLEELATARAFYGGEAKAVSFGSAAHGSDSSSEPNANGGEDAMDPSTEKPLCLSLAQSPLLLAAVASAANAAGATSGGGNGAKGHADPTTMALPPAPTAVASRTGITHWMPSAYYYETARRHAAKAAADSAAAAAAAAALASGGGGQSPAASPQSGGLLGAPLSPAARGRSRSLSNRSRSSFLATTGGGGGGLSLVPNALSAAPRTPLSPSHASGGAGSSADPFAIGSDPFADPATARLLSRLLFDEAYPNDYARDPQRDSGFASTAGPSQPFACHVAKAVLEDVNDACVARSEVAWGPAGGSAADYCEPLAEAFRRVRAQHLAANGGSVGRTGSSRRASSASGGAAGRSVSAAVGSRGQAPLRRSSSPNR